MNNLPSEPLARLGRARMSINASQSGAAYSNLSKAGQKKVCTAANGSFDAKFNSQLNYSRNKLFRIISES